MKGKTMAKYRVYGIMTASVVIGEYEADNEEDAIEKANKDPRANWHPSVCHMCSREIDLGDIDNTEVELVGE